jgi:mannosyltransferase OCH1-like enzyme
MSSIPKEIFQTWKTRDVPDKWKESQLSIIRHLPDWKYTLYTDEDNREFVKTHFPDFLSYYDNFPYNIQRADAIRYMYLYINGGVYMDLDIALQKPIHDLLGDEDFYLVPSGNISSSFTNSFMISKPRASFWLNVIEEMKKPASILAFTKHFIVMNTTGPIMLTRVAKEYNGKFGYLPVKQIIPCSICNFNYCDTSASYTKILIGQSWCNIDTEFFNFFMCNWKKVIMIVSLFIITYIIFLILRLKKLI